MGAKSIHASTTPATRRTGEGIHILVPAPFSFFAETITTNGTNEDFAESEIVPSSYGFNMIQFPITAKGSRSAAKGLEAGPIVDITKPELYELISTTATRGAGASKASLSKGTDLPRPKKWFYRAPVVESHLYSKNPSRI